MPEPNPTSLIPFTFDGAPVRALLVDGEPHFVGKDVAERLGYADATTAIRSHCKGVQKQHPLQTSGGMQNVRILAEPDVLRLIVGSKLPAAERFERWVFEEVLPTIRKTGSYTAPGANPYSPDKIAAVREARLTFGRAAAQKVWHAAGLPPVSPLPEEPRQSSMFDAPAAERPTLADLPALSRPRSARTLTADLLARIDARVAAGATIRAACEAEGANYQTVRNKTHLMRAAARHQH